MPVSGTADLLFRIAGDSSQAQGDLQAFRGVLGSQLAGMGTQFEGLSATAVSSWRGALARMAAASKASQSVILFDAAGDPIKQITRGFADMGEAAAGAGRKAAGEMKNARVATRALGNDLGVHMPRFVGNWLSSLGGVAPVMAAAFTPLAIIGFIQVLAQIPGQIQKGIDWLHGWTEESKKAFEESTKHALKWQTDVIAISERLRAVQLIGVEGIQKYNLEMAINAKNVSEVATKLDELQAKRTALNSVVNWKPPKQTAAQELAGLSLTGEATGVRNVVPKGPSSEEIDKAKIQLKELEPAVEALTEKLRDLTIHGKELAAETAAEATRVGKARIEAAEKFTADLQQRLSKEQEQTLAIRKAEWDAEVDGLAKSYGKEATITREQAALLAQLRTAGYARIERESKEAGERKAEEIRRETAQLQQMLTAQQAQTLETRQRAFDQEMDERAARMAANRKLSQEEMDLIARVRAAGHARISREDQQAEEQAARELQQALRKLGAETLADRLRDCDEEIEQRRTVLREAGRLGKEEEELLEALRKAGRKKIEAEDRAAFDAEMARLQEQLVGLRSGQATPKEQIQDKYAADAAKFDAAEEKKSKAAAQSEAHRAETAKTYAAIRAALYKKEQGDLNALANSTGWRAVFGNQFGQMIRQNESLTKQWSQAQNQSHLLVRASLEGLKEQGQKSFDQLAQGMGSGIADAIAYQKSIGAAMKAALASTLESLAAQAITYAIYSTALGFLRLAQWDYEGAANAFASAAIWGSVGAAAAVAGRAISGGSSSSSSSSSNKNAAGTTSVSSSSETGSGSSSGANGSHVTVNVWGHVVGTSGVSELAGMLNDAVLNKDVTLTATNTKTGGVVTK